MSADKCQTVTVEITIPDGNATGVRVVKLRLNWEGLVWNGSVIVCPRACYQTAKSMKEFNQPGVYVLRKANAESPPPKIYIGNAETLSARLNNHNTNKNWWEDVFICVGESGGHLNKAHVEYLESRMIEKTKLAKLCDSSENIDKPKLRYLSPDDVTWVESFLTKLLFVLRVLGLNIFETPPNSGDGTSGESATGMFFINSKGVAAKGYQNAGEFVVLANSEAVLQIVPSALAGRIDIFRKSLESQGVLKAENGRLKFTKNYSFSSPSAAAAVIIGGEADGRRQWKNEQGKSINDLEVEAAAAIET